MSKDELEFRIREHAMEPIGRKKLGEFWRYLAKFALNDTAFVWLNLQADQVESGASIPETFAVPPNP